MSAHGANNTGFENIPRGRDYASQVSPAESTLGRTDGKARTTVGTTFILHIHEPSCKGHLLADYPNRDGLDRR